MGADVITQIVSLPKPSHARSPRPDSLPAPVEEGQSLGHLTVLVDGEKKGELPLVAGEAVEKLSLLQVYQGLLTTLFCGG